MSYRDRFIPTDSLIPHLTTLIGTITDPLILANYAGFLSVSAVTVYELAIKDIFFDFGAKKNKYFGDFVEKHFNRLNGRIKFGELRGSHISLFGDKYLKKFDKIFSVRHNDLLSTSRVDIEICYSNLIICRHEFVHGGSPTLTIGETIHNYHHGKEVIHCLDNAMKR